MVLLGIDLGFGGRFFPPLCGMSPVAGGDISVCRRSRRQGSQSNKINKLLLWPKLKWRNCALPCSPSWVKGKSVVSYIHRDEKHF